MCVCVCVVQGVVGWVGVGVVVVVCGVRFISTCEDEFFKNCATFTFGITRAIPARVYYYIASGMRCVLIQSVTNSIRVTMESVAT